MRHNGSVATEPLCLTQQGIEVKIMTQDFGVSVWLVEALIKVAVLSSAQNKMEQIAYLEKCFRIQGSTYSNEGGKIADTLESSSIGVNSPLSAEQLEIVLFFQEAAKNRGISLLDFLSCVREGLSETCSDLCSLAREIESSTVLAEQIALVLEVGICMDIFMQEYKLLLPPKFFRELQPAAAKILEARDDIQFLLKESDLDSLVAEKFIPLISTVLLSLGGDPLKLDIESPKSDVGNDEGCFPGNSDLTKSVALDELKEIVEADAIIAWADQQLQDMPPMSAEEIRAKGNEIWYRIANYPD